MNDRRHSRRKHLAFLSAAAMSTIAPIWRTEAQGVSDLRLLTLATDVGGLGYYAKDTGAYERAELKVDVGSLRNGAAALAAVLGGTVDICEENAGTIAAGVLKGLPLTIIADGGLYESKAPTSLLCVVPDSPIKSAQDLEGKRVAVGALSGIGEMALQAWLEKNGANPAKVSFIELPFGAMGESLSAGRIDAGFIAEPALAAALPKLRSIGTPYDAVAPEFSFSSYVAKTDWVVGNRATAGRFAAVMRQTAEWANANHPETARILAKYLMMPDIVTKTMTRVRYATSLQAAHLQPNIDIMFKSGLLAKRIDANTLITRV